MARWHVRGTGAGVAQPRAGIRAPHEARADGTRGNHEGSRQGDDLDDVDGAAMEEATRTGAAVDDPESGPGEEKGHGTGGQDAEAALVAQEAGRELEPVHDLHPTDDGHHRGNRAGRHPEQFGPRKMEQRGGVQPIVGDEERGGPRGGGDATGNHALMGPWMPTRPRPPVGEMMGPDDHETEAGDHHQQRRGQTASPSPHQGAPRRPGQRSRGRHEEKGEKGDGDRHHDHGDLGLHGVRSGPLPADRELGPDGHGHDEEARQRPAQGHQGAAGTIGGGERSTGQPGDGETGHDAAAEDVDEPGCRVWPLVELGHQERGELLAVAGAPLLRVDAQQPLRPSHP